jgi:transcriptional regulator with XRE-family HTH domain
LDDFDRALGDRLRAARRRRGWSLHEVERRSGNEFKSSVLGAYERGERAISVQRLYRLGNLYGVDVANLIPTAREIAGEDVAIDLDAVGEADSSIADAIDRYLSAIQVRRRSRDGGLAVRQSDLELLAALVRSDRSTLRRIMSELEQ